MCDKSRAGQPCTACQASTPTQAPSARQLARLIKIIVRTLDDDREAWNESTVRELDDAQRRLGRRTGYGQSYG